MAAMHGRSAFVALRIRTPLIGPTIIFFSAKGRRDIEVEDAGGGHIKRNRNRNVAMITPAPRSEVAAMMVTINDNRFSTAKRSNSGALLPRCTQLKS
jgi:hypothetical protein